jgi:hypothetical protein
MGILFLVLLAVSAPGASAVARVLRLILGIGVVLPGSFLLQAMFKDFIRFAC